LAGSSILKARLLQHGGQAGELLPSYNAGNDRSFTLILMNIRRQLLFSAYRIASTIGVFSVRNASSPYASILMYHRVKDDDPDCLSTPIDAFEETLATLKQRYRTIPLSSLVERLSHKQKIDSGTVVITFDDGYRDNFLTAAPLLRKYQLPATFFVTSEYINTSRIFPWDAESSIRHELMNWDDIRELSRMGFEIGGHTSNHVNLGTVTFDEAEREIAGCKEKIEREIGKEISLFAYPFGGRDCIRDEILPLIRNAGFSCCCSGYGGKVSDTSDPFALNRVPVYQTTTEMFMEIDNFVTLVDGKTRIHITAFNNGDRNG
jgi:peptidoglycan/xylan/chitin deacetylase (PgdA/CDA1 family)